MKREKTPPYLIGGFSAFLIFLLLGTITVLIPNSFFRRMSPVHYYDYIFLIATSLLFGAFAGLWFYQKRISKKSASQKGVSQKIASKKSCGLAAGGTLGGLFSFGCAVCNHLLVFLLGTAFLTAYFIPIQPLLGIISIILLSMGVYRQYKSAVLTQRSILKINPKQKTR